MTIRFAILSLLLNVVLLAGILFVRRPSAPVRDGQSKPNAAATDLVPGHRVRTNVEQVEITITNSVAPFIWSQIQTQDLRHYVANLRAVGCPPETVHEIVRGELRRFFLEGRRRLLDPWQGQYWDLALRGGGAPLKELRPEIERLHAATLGQLAGLLEPPPAKEATRTDRSRESLTGYLPAEKQRQLIQLLEDYDRGTRALAREPGSGLTPAQREEAARQLRQRRDDGLRALLTPEESAEYELRKSRFAQAGADLPGLDISEEELRKLTRIATAFAGATEGLDAKDPAKARAREQAKREQEDALKQLFGEEGYAHYQQAIDPGFAQIHRITEKYELPLQTAQETDQIRRAAVLAAQQLRQNTALSDEARRELLGQIQDQTRDSLRQTLGDRPARTYEKHFGEWLSGMPER